MSAAESNRRWADYLARAQREHGSKLDLSGVPEKFRRLFQGSRVKVNFGTEEDPLIKTGTVSITTGWKPSLMLMLRSDSMGSSWLLSERDTILAIQHYSGRYIPAADLAYDPNNPPAFTPL